jgi:pseudouridine-5'-phosphate glycosidase
MITTGLPIVVAPEVEEALSSYERTLPVVALETAVVSHGLPFPDNIRVTQQMMAAVREAGAVPAVIALAGGKIHVGADDDLIQELARAESVRKVNLSNFAPILAAGELGGTTVAATVRVARIMGITVFVTGGIGGRHRPTSATAHDVSADLPALSNTRVLTVCSGVKSILDVAGTREMLETLGVPVIGVGCDTLPLFISPPSVYPVDARADDPKKVAEIARTHWAIGGQGLLATVPCPGDIAIDAERVNALLAEIEAELPEEVARDGRKATPWILRALDERTDGASRAANIALLVNNARVGGAISVAINDLDRHDDVTSERRRLEL